MPHAPYCHRNRRPSLWQRIRYGKLAHMVMLMENPCEACERTEGAPPAHWVV